MANTMSLDYETVTYNTGKMDAASPELFVTGFGNANYDRTPSPLNDYSAESDSMNNFDDEGNPTGGQGPNPQPRPDSVSIINQGMAAAIAANQASSPNKRTPSAEAFFPTNASSPTDINQGNQGIPTVANNNTTPDAPTPAGRQVKSLTDSK